MREQPVIADADPKTAGQPPEDRSGDQIGPAKKEKRRNSEDVKERHGNDRVPVEFRVFVDRNSGVCHLVEFPRFLEKWRVRIVTFKSSKETPLRL